MYSNELHQNRISAPNDIASRGKKLPILEFLVILFFAVYFLLPSVSATVNFMVSFFFAGGYLLYIGYKDAKQLALVAKFLAVVAWIAFLFFVLTDSKTISHSSSNYFLKVFFSKANQTLMTFFAVYLVYRLVSKANQKQKKFFLIFACALFAYIIFNTTAELIENPDATRSWANFEEQSENDVGTYAYIYAVPIVITALTSLLFKNKSTFLKVVLIAVIVFLFFFLTLAQYTLALLIAFVGVVLQINNNIKNQGIKILLWLLLGVLLLFLPNILEFLASKIESEQMTTRLLEIAAFFKSGDTSGYNLSSRFELYKQTVIAFFRSPIIGNRSLPFNGHATFLTLPADIGIFGAVPYFALLIACKRKVCMLLQNEQRQFIPVFICLVLMGLTNPIHSALPLSFAVWALAPMLLYMGVDKNETQVGD